MSACGAADVETEDEEEDEEDELGDDDDDMTSGARPRRISELKIPNKVKPIPLASSLFVFSPTNRQVVSDCRLLSTHANSQGVDISVPVCLFVCLFVCFVILCVCLYG